MRDKGLRYQELAARTDYGVCWLGQVANGRVRPSPKLRRAIARALEVPEHELFDGDGR